MKEKGMLWVVMGLTTEKPSTTTDMKEGKCLKKVVMVVCLANRASEMIKIVMYIMDKTLIAALTVIIQQQS